MITLKLSYKAIKSVITHLFRKYVSVFDALSVNCN